MKRDQPENQYILAEPTGNDTGGCLNLEETNWSKLGQSDQKNHIQGLIHLVPTAYTRTYTAEPKPQLNGNNLSRMNTNTPNDDTLWEFQRFFLFQNRSVFNTPESNCCQQKRMSYYRPLLFAFLLDFSLRGMWVKFICCWVYLLLLICFFYSTAALKLTGQLGRSLTGPAILLSH